MGSSALKALAAVALAVVVEGVGPAPAQVPTFRDATGHDFGERITQHHEMQRYVERLAATSPRVVAVDQGASWEGRRLVLAVVTSPANHDRLEQIRETAIRLGDPRATTPVEARELSSRQPVVVWLGGSIHGFELSGSEGLLKLLEHLTTRNDPATLAVLENAVVLVDPVLNPDGRDAFAQLNHQNIGREPSSKREDWANDFNGWEAIKFRTGHYYYDINRDWFAHTYPETGARVPTLRRWRPQVVVDAHEMGPDVEFYFDPPGDPVAPYFPDFASRWFKQFGEDYAEAFDSAGFEYMTRERYNYFYPGYTTSYGSYQGAVGMLFEQGSSRGLALARPDGSVRSLADALEQHYVATWTAVRVAAENRTALLAEYYQAQLDAVADGAAGIRRYLIGPGGDPNLLAELAAMLYRNGIEVDVLTAPVTLAGVRDRVGRTLGERRFPAGTFVVDAAQPRNRLSRTLLEPDVPIPAAFLEWARARVERDENPGFYDITAWSLPLLFNVDGYSSPDGAAATTTRFAGQDRAITLPPADRVPYAYVIDGRQAAALSAAYHLRAQGYRASMTLKPTRVAGSALASGSLVVRTGPNEAGVGAAVRDLARRFTLDVLALPTGLSDSGYPALGSADVIPVQTPEIAMLAEDPIQGYSFGYAWYMLDRQYEIPVTPLRVRSIASTRLDSFNVLIVPEASTSALTAALGDSGLARINRWIADGGTLVALGRSVDLVRESMGAEALRSWYETEDGEQQQRFNVPGAFMRGTLDNETWLSSGYDGQLPVFVNSSRVYLAPEGPPSSRRRVVGRYGQLGDLRLSGHAWIETLERLPGTVFAYEERVGRGRVILFTEDLNFRGYWRGADRLFLNAVVLGPSAP